MKASTKPRSQKSANAQRTKKIRRSFFPAPEYLAMSSVGFDISDHSIKYAKISGTTGGLRIKQFGTHEIPEGIIESGFVKDTEALGKELKTLNKRLHAHFARVSLPEEQLFSFELALPSLEHHQIRGAIELRIAEEVPYSAEEIYFDHSIIKETTDEVFVHVMAIKREVADAYVAAFHASNITPVALELESQALARAVVPEGFDETALVVDLGKNRTGLSVAHQGHVFYTSTILIDNANLKEELAEVATAQENSDANTPVAGTAVALQQRFDKLIQEVQEVIRYWNSNLETTSYHKEPIARIILSGGAANAEVLVTYLQEELSIEVAKADSLANITRSKNKKESLTEEARLIYATAIGLALGDYTYD